MARANSYEGCPCRYSASKALDKVDGCSPQRRYVTPQKVEYVSLQEEAKPMLWLALLGFEIGRQ